MKQRRTKLHGSYHFDMKQARLEARTILPLSAALL